ncbi:MAG: hypothetical protein ACRDOJ_12155 [Nocardioidaceae bacterium]
MGSVPQPSERHQWHPSGTGPGTATEPGGGNPRNVALVNVGPRLEEPQPFVAGLTLADTAVGAAVTAPWWREQKQGTQLTLGDVSPFSANVDFGRLHDRVRDKVRRGLGRRTQVDRTGPWRTSGGAHQVVHRGRAITRHSTR